MRPRPPKFPRCPYCHENCYAIDFQDNIMGGCEDQRAWFKKRKAEKELEKNKKEE